MTGIEFSREEKELIARKIQLYFSEELEQEIGPLFYHRGLYEAQAALENQLESFSEAIYAPEKPTQFSR